jgi:exodeoxyribonuclease VII large subunit
VARGGGSIEDLWAFNDERVARAIAASQAPVITGVGHETDFTIADFAADLRAPTPTAAAELATPHRDDLRAGLADQAGRLGRTIQAALSSQRWELGSLQNRLLLHSPQARLRNDRQRLDDLSRRIGVAVSHSMQLRRARRAALDQRLNALSPLGVLGRGYAVVSHPDGQVVRSLHQVKPDDELSVRVSDGQFQARALGD